MFIPMGTVVTACMIVCVIFTNRVPAGALNARTPAFALQAVGIVCGAAGLWNVLWHASRHITQFWGLMALGSGLLLIALSALLVLPKARVPLLLEKMRPIMVIALAGFAGWTIYNL